MAAGSKLAVGSAIVGNTFVMIAKFIAFGVTGSGAMLSEGVHSLADTLNQILLMVGVVRSERTPDEKRPYGYGKEQYVWALMSAVGIFFLGCGVTLYHGISGFLHPHKLGSLNWAIGVLIVSFIVEALILYVAVKAVQKEAGDRPFFEYLKKESDPATAAVLLEDAVACIGILLALGGIFLAQTTGDPRWDAVASISIGLLLGFVAIWLIQRNHTLLVGEAVPARVEEEVKAILNANPTVEEVTEFKGHMVDLKTYDIMANIEFKGEVFAEQLSDQLHEAYDNIETFEDFQAFASQFADDVVEALGDEIDKLEAEIREKFPQAKHVDIETN